MQNLIALPDAIGFVEAAAFPLTFLTAWHMLLTRAALQSGEIVLVIGAGSGVGQAAIQIARLHGGRVIATAGSVEKLRVRARSAPSRPSITRPRMCRRSSSGSTDGRGVDVVVEHVGTATWEASVKCLSRGGRLVTCGATTGHDARIDLRFLFGRQLSLLGSYMGRKGELIRAAAALLRGELAPVSTAPMRSTTPPRPIAGSSRARRSGRSSCTRRTDSCRIRPYDGRAGV